jgi:hypothetical protein
LRPKHITMRKNYLTFCFLILSAIASAQITITSADLPVVGLAFTRAVDDNYVAAIPPGGAAQTWNYSSLLNTYVDTVAFMPVAGTPFAAQFPTANLASYDPSSGTYAYFTSNTTGFYQNGATDTSLAAGYVAFNPAYLFIPTPFTYLDTRTSTGRAEIYTTFFDSTLGNVNIKIVHHIESTFLCDGWGSLQLPNATYNNTLRAKVTELSTDSILADPFNLGIYSFVTATTTQTVAYRWVGHGPAAYLLGINADSLGTTSESSEYLLNSVVLGTHEASGKNSSVLAYPNPASDKMNFAWGQEIQATGLTIFNAIGQVVAETKMNGINKLEIPVSALPNGIYFYQLTTVQGQIEKGKFNVAH